MRLLLVLILLASLLSGCSALGDGPTLMTAKQALAPANRAASNWADDAALMDAESQELDDEARREAADEFNDEKEELQEARDDGDISDSDYDNYTELFKAYEPVLDTHDGDVGDGRSSAWFFSFYSESEQDMYLVAVAHGDVVFRKTLSDLYGDEEFDFEDFLDEPALGEWKVDSHQASEAAQLDEDYQRICGETNIVSYMSLSEGESGPVWYIGASHEGSGEDDGEYTDLVVDAVNGSLIVDDSIDVPQPIDDLLYQESGNMDGDFIASVQFTSTDTFDVIAEGHVQVGIDVTVSPGTAQPVHVTVTDPEGSVTEFDVVAAVNPVNGRATTVLQSAPVGTYTVELSVPLALYSSYDISWCTDGVPTAQGDFQERACNLVVQGGSAGAARGETLSWAGRWLAAW